MPDETHKPPNPDDEDDGKKKPDDDSRDRKNEPPKKDGDGDLGGQNPDEIFDSIRRNEVLRGLRSERDVSLVYIDRHRVQNIYGAEGGPGYPRPVDAAPGPAQRLADLVVNPISPGETELIRQVYVEPTLFPIAQERFRQSGLLVLCGPRQTGKRAAALRLLGQLTDGEGKALPLYELNPDQKLRDLRADNLPANAGLLLESPNGEALADCTTFQIKGLQGAFGPERKNNGLVILTEKLPAAFPRDQRGLVLDWALTWPGDPGETRRTILEKHLMARSQGEPDVAATLDAEMARLLGDARLLDRLREHLGPGELADLAERLLPVIRGQQSLDEALARFGAQVQREVGGWFAQPGHDLEMKLLMIAAAVFNGALVEEVETAQKDLLQRVRPPAAKKEEEAPAFVDPFDARFSRRGRLESINAELREIAIPGSHYGEASAQALALRNDAWQKAVLYHIWEDVTPLRQPLLAWLGDHSVNGSRRVRIRAAAAVGALACHSFPHIEASLLREWANSIFPDHRASAAQVLGITIWDEGQSAASSRLLHSWASTTNNPRLQWTAATAYGGLAGLRYPQQALTDLQRVALNTLEQPLLLPPIFQGFLTQFALTDLQPGRRLAILQELLNWAEYREEEVKDRGQRLHRERAIRRTGLLTFDLLLKPEANDPIWRMIVTDAGAPGQAQELTAKLLLAALTFRQPTDSARDSLHPRKLALENLRQLIVHTPPKAKDPSQEAEELYHHLEGLLSALMALCRQQSPDTADLLRYHAAYWDDARPDGSDLIDILLNG